MRKITLNQRINYRGILIRYSFSNLFSISNKHTGLKTYCYYFNMCLGSAAHFIYMLDGKKPLLWKPKN